MTKIMQFQTERSTSHSKIHSTPSIGRSTDARNLFCTLCVCEKNFSLYHYSSVEFINICRFVHLCAFHEYENLMQYQLYVYTVLPCWWTPLEREPLAICVLFEPNVCVVWGNFFGATQGHGSFNLWILNNAWEDIFLLPWKFLMVLMLHGYYCTGCDRSTLMYIHIFCITKKLILLLNIN